MYLMSRHTCVNLATNAKYRLAESGADHGAVLRLVADDFLVAVLDELSIRLAPGRRQRGQSLEFVAWHQSVKQELSNNIASYSPQYVMTSGENWGGAGRLSQRLGFRFCCCCFCFSCEAFL